MGGKTTRTAAVHTRLGKTPASSAMPRRALKVWWSEGGMARAAMKLKASGGAKRHISIALAISEYAGVWRGTSR